MRTFPALLAAAGLAACASAAQRAFVAPSNDTVISTTEEGRGADPSETIYVENRSTVGIMVYSVTLRGCTNVKQPCDPRPVSIRIPAGGRRQVIRVQPKDPQAGYEYSFTYGWRADSANSTAALAAMAQNGDSTSRNRLTAIQQAEAERAADPVGSHDQELGSSDYAKLNIAKLRLEPESLVVHVGSSVALRREVRVMALGPSGETLGRARALRWRVYAGAVSFTQPDTITARFPGRSIVTFELSSGTAGVSVPNVAPVDLPVIVVP